MAGMRLAKEVVAFGKAMNNRVTSNSPPTHRKITLKGASFVLTSALPDVHLIQFKRGERGDVWALPVSQLTKISYSADCARRLLLEFTSHDVDIALGPPNGAPSTAKLKLPSEFAAGDTAIPLLARPEDNLPGSSLVFCMVHGLNVRTRPDYASEPSRPGQPLDSAQAFPLAQMLAMHRVNSSKDQPNPPSRLTLYFSTEILELTFSFEEQAQLETLWSLLLAPHEDELLSLFVSGPRVLSKSYGLRPLETDSEALSPAGEDLGETDLVEDASNGRQTAPQPVGPQKKQIETKKKVLGGVVTQFLRFAGKQTKRRP